MIHVLCKEQKHCNKLEIKRKREAEIETMLFIGVLGQIS